MADSHSYRPDIDGLRAVAVLAVIAFHAFPRVLPGGFIGVDVFFVISGYLITGILLREADSKGTISIRGFYARRCWRILPALLVMMLVTFGVGWHLLYPDELTSLAHQMVAGSLFVSNMHLWKTITYFHSDSGAMPLLHLWSLGVEEQFYLIWPLFLLVATRLLRRRTGVLALVFLASFACNVGLIEGHASAVFYFLPARMWELVAGAILAQIETRPMSVPRWCREVASLVGLIALLLGVTSLNEHSSFPGYGALLPVMGATFLVAAGPGASFNRWVLGCRPMVFLGLISYPLYLWHRPLLVYARMSSILSVTGALAATLLMSAATFFLLETPLKRQVAAGRGRFAAVAMTGGFAAILCGSAAVLRNDGFPSRVPDTARLEGMLTADTRTDEACLNLSGVPEGLFFCRANPHFPEASVALIGDSHANHLFYGLSSVYEQAGLGLVNLGLNSCPSFADEHFHPGIFTTQERCLSVNDAILSYVERTPAIKTVLLSSYFPDEENWSFDGQTDDGSEAARSERLAAIAVRLNALVDRLVKGGRRVVVLGEVPGPWFSPRDCFRQGLTTKHPDITCAQDKALTEAHLKGADSFFRQVSSKACFFDPVPAFRAGDGYRIVKDGQLIFYDKHHLNPWGSVVFAEAFVRSPCFSGRSPESKP